MSDAESRSPVQGHSGIEHWRRLVRKALKGQDPSVLSWRLRDGIVVEPLHERRAHGSPLTGRGAQPWTIIQVVDDRDPDGANAQALVDLKGGASGLSLRFAGAPRAGAFGLPAEPAALAIALEGVDLATIHLRIEPHPECLSASRWLSDWTKKGGTAPELADIAFGLDPVIMAAAGDVDAAALTTGLRDLAAARFRGPLATLDGSPYYEAGATEAQELAGVLGAAAWWLRALDKAGMAPSEALPFLGASLSVDHDQFVSIAKLRAMRLLWARLQELCTASHTPLALHAETGRRVMSCADPETNLLRTTIAAFAAGVGGADSVTVLPYNAARGVADGNARALARNIQCLLIDEAHVYRAEDPGAGSGLIESITEALAERAWSEFQTIEREGGIVASLRSGAFSARIADARTALEKDIADGTVPLVGVTLYPQEDQATATPPTAPDPLAGLGLAPMRLEAAAGAAA